MEPVRAFFVNGARLMRRCTKPDRAEFTRLVKAVRVGVMFMGWSGVCIKLAGAHLFRRNY